MEPQTDMPNAEAAMNEPAIQPSLHICGVNQDRAALGIRELFALSPERCRETLERIRTEGLAAEAMVLSTCNRTEVYAWSLRQDSFSIDLENFFFSLASRPLDPAHLPPIYSYDGIEAVRHIFAVNSGLDSMILGENEIKAQIRQAYELSLEAGMAGPNLHSLIERTHRCAKKIRTETDLNAGTLSVGKATVLTAEEVLGGLAGKTCVVIGAGKVGKVAAQAVAERSPARLCLINRTLDRAQEVADEIGAEAVPIPMMGPVIREADLIIGAAFAPNFLVTREMFEKLRGSGGADRPVCLIDAAVPRILDQAISGLPGVTLLDISHMESVIAANRARRTAAAQKAWEFVEEEVEKFKGRMRQSSIGPRVERLKALFDAVHDDCITKLEHEMTGDGLEAAKLAQRRLKQRLFHAAVSELKNIHEELS